jgi:POT family proton-dependent oligopeptide transporter
MSQDHELANAELHQELPAGDQSFKKDIMGAPLAANVSDEKRQPPPEYEGGSTHSDPEKGGFRDTPVGEEPTDDEKRRLRHVGESLPKSAFLVAIVELCERFTYYGCQGIFQNYIMLSPEEGRGGLGQGHQTATAMGTFFQFWCYVTPILGAIIADQYLGKYKTIVLFASVYVVGLLFLWTTALPSSLHSGNGVWGLWVSIIIIGLGTGGIKSNVAPLIADQYTRRKMAISVDAKTGERVVIDPTITIQRIYMIFYWCINVGALSLLATPYMELYTGFWSAYLLCFCMFFVGFTVLVLGRKMYVVRPPQGSIITNAFRCIWIMVMNRNMDAPKPSWQEAKGRQGSTRWDDKFVEEVKRALVACQVFCFYPLYWVVYGQFSNNFVTQALQMEGHGIPNDLMQNFDPIAIIVFVPLLDRIVYPMLRKARINFPPINRIVLGFWTGGLAMAYAAIVQHLIYTSGPCYESPLCNASKVDGVAMGNHVHIAIQTPAYMLIGISEIFASVTGLEYAYTKAPQSMKSFVQSMFLLTNAFGAALSMTLVSVAYDPAILWMFVGLAISSFVVGGIIWVLFHKYNKTEDEMNALG